MKLEFSLLVIDDNPDSVDGAIGGLEDHLAAKGFSLKKQFAKDLSANALRDLARSSGRDFNLVMVDYNLGRADINGAAAAARMRRELQFTDMVFYSSEPTVDLLSELAKQQVAGVFVAGRNDLDDALKGLADTVIGKAVDLNHMRGIAMAEVADMDVQMEEILELAFSKSDACLESKAERTLTKLLEGVAKQHLDVKSLVDKKEIVELVIDPRLFPSSHKYRALIRLSDCLPEKPDEALKILQDYQADVIDKRNAMAHAKEERGEDGELSLRAIKRGKASTPIDEAWMADFRGTLRTQRDALGVVCNALRQHVDGIKGK